MAQDGPDSLGCGVVHRATLPIRWRQAGDGERADPGGALRVLRLALALDDWDHLPEPHGDEAGADPVLARIDLRLNLLLELLGEHLADTRPEAPARALEWSAERLCWEGGGPAPGAWVRIELWLEPRLPRPLVLFGRAEEAQAGRASVRLEPLAGEAGELLTRYLFRQHRRAVARARSGGRAGPRIG